METLKAREIAHETAQIIIGSGDPLPTCNGCPDGAFEERVDRWLKKLANMVGHRTFLKWTVGSIGAPPIAFVLQAEQGAGGEPPFLEFPIARIDVYGPTRRVLSLIEPEAVEVPAPAETDIPSDRDRVGELLEGQARLEQQVAQLQAVVKAQGLTVTGFLQRLIMLTSHFGMAPWFGTVTLGPLTFSVQLQRPGPVEEPRK